MKIITTIGLGLCALISSIQAQDNNVILDYDQVSLGYGYTDDALGILGNGHGLGLGVSREINQFVVSLSNSESWIDTSDILDGIDLFMWDLNLNTGYVTKLTESVHLVPSIGLGYAQLHGSGLSGSSKLGSTWAFNTALTLNYSPDESWEFSWGLLYSDPFNSDSDFGQVELQSGLGLTLGATFRISDNTGMNLNAVFSDDNGFGGMGVALEYHF